MTADSDPPTPELDVEKRPLFHATRHVRAIIVWVLFLMLGVLSIWPLITPTPPTATAPTEFSVDRALEHVANIAREPHPIGSAANVRVRDYLVGELITLGLQPQLQSVTVPDYYGEPGKTVEVVNVIARIPGMDSTGAVALVAHYDSVPTTLGADDDAAAVAAILEVARIILHSPRLENDVLILLTDGEEPAPRYGSSAFVAEHPWAADIGFVVNFEASGGSGPSMLIETNGPDHWLIDGLAGAGSSPAAFSFFTQTTDLLGGSNTDFASFRAVGIPGLSFAYLRDSPIYHTLNDAPDRVGRGSLAHHGAHALALTRHFGNADLTQPPASEKLIYFTVGRSLLVRYPVRWALPLALLVAALFCAATYRRVKRQVSSIRALHSGVGMTMLGLVLAVLTTTLVWRALTSLRSGPGVMESYAHLFGLTTLIIGVWQVTRWFARRRPDRVDLAGGVVLIWVLSALATSATLPGWSYLFVWPGLAGALLLLGIVGAWTTWARPYPLLLVIMPALVLLVPAIDVSFQVALPRPGNRDSQVVEVIAVTTLLIFLAVALITSSISDHRSSKTVLTPE